MAYQPKSYKKFVATAATATLVASAVVPVAFAAQTATDFSDVAPQYKDAVDYLVDNTIAAGKTPSTFGTAENIIRVDAAIWIAKATLTDGEISAAPASNFTDVPDRGKIYVDALKSKGYVNGSSAKAFNSYANISRGEVALILAEAYDITGNTANNKFTDVSSRYAAAVSALKDNGITSGKTSTRFGTGDAITRGELAIWVYKLENLGALTVSNLNVAVDGSKATVTADVKNAESNADATVSVYPNGNLSATPIVNSTTVVGGQVTSTFNDVPAGNHTVVVKVGDVSSSKSFTIATAPTPLVSSTYGNSTTDEITLIFNKPVDTATAKTLRNYTYDFDSTDNKNLPVFPISVVVNEAAVGGYAPGQVVTVKFDPSSLSENDKGLLNVVNLKGADGSAIPTQNLEVYPQDSLGVVPDVYSILDNGTQAVQSGSNVTLNVYGSAGNVEVSSLRYRIQRPDNTFTTWVNVPAEDGGFDEIRESGKATISTTGFTGGRYTIQTQVVDKAGRVDADSNTFLDITRVDIDGPSVTAAGSYNSVASGSRPANSVNISGTATDFGQESDIASVQYRVQSYDANTNTYTTSTDWSSASAADGAFNEAQEEYGVTTPKLNNSTTYRIQVRSTDVKGNVGATTTVGTVSGLQVTNGQFTTPAGSLDTTGPVLTALTGSFGASDSISNDNALTLSGTYTDNGIVSNVEYAVYMDADNNSSYETLVKDYSTTGVKAEDGSFNEAAEAFVIDYTVPATNGKYKVLVRGIDNSGNKSAATAYNFTYDTAAPSVTSIVPNTETPALNDFIVTYSESVNTSAATNNDGLSGSSALDYENYTVQQNGQVVGNSVTNVVQTSPTNAKVFVVTFASQPTNAQTINVTSVRDLANNAISPTRFNVNQ